jgi:RND superfamily putative drug exporter
VRKLAILIVRHRWWVIVAALIVVPVAGIVGGGVHARLSSGGFEDPGTESARAKADLKRSFPQASLSDFVVVVTHTHGTLYHPAF